MKTSVFLKIIFTSIFFQSGFVARKLAKRCNAGSFSVLIYHRIIPPNKTIQAGMNVTPGTFGNHLKYLKEKFTVIPLNRLALSPENSAITSPEKPVCVLTFDDGWKDFYDFAFPLLQKYQPPATVFLPTEFIGSNKKFWTDNFADILSRRQPTALEGIYKPGIPKIVQRLYALPGTYEAQLEAGISLLKNHPRNMIDEVLVELARSGDVKTDVSDRDFLNWSEIYEMLNSGLISFGSHTVTHQILTTLDDTAIKRVSRFQG